ncbi:hypothetical protein EB061_07415 [bacterium]|jgi:hypothetical protein|nr:hypothetical protein [bacterium]
MATTREYSVEIRSRNQRGLPPTTGTLITIHWDKQERLRNSFKTTLLMLGLMAGSALIPFWHFFLVPTFFALAWILGMGKYGE